MRNLLCAGMCLLALSGCAAVRGSQASSVALRSVAPMAIDDAMIAYASPRPADRHDMSKFDFREYIITVRMAAIDDEYDDFTNQLNAGQRGAGLGFDLLILGLSGATALAGPSAVDELATATTVAAGARASVDKHIFFNQTVPALVAIMDAERAEIKTAIVRKRGLPVEQYSLGNAIDDLNALRRAGRIDAALGRLTQAAQAQKAQQEARLADIKGSCDDITVRTGALNARFRRLVRDDVPAMEPTRARLAGSALGMTFADSQAVTFADVRDTFDEQLCDDNKKAQYLDSLEAAIAAAEGG